MADGSIIKTLGVCHEVIVLIQGYKFVVDFNVLHLGVCSGPWHLVAVYIG